MYNRTRAQALGFLTPCEARLQEPMTLEGNYLCREGHFHYVSWSHGLPTVSPWGFTPAFLAAIEQAENDAIALALPGTWDFQERYNTVLTTCGFEAVVLERKAFTSHEEHKEGL